MLKCTPCSQPEIPRHPAPCAGTGGRGRSGAAALHCRLPAAPAHDVVHLVMCAYLGVSGRSRWDRGRGLSRRGCAPWRPRASSPSAGRRLAGGAALLPPLPAHCRLPAAPAHDVVNLVMGAYLGVSGRSLWEGPLAQRDGRRGARARLYSLSRPSSGPGVPRCCRRSLRTHTAAPQAALQPAWRGCYRPREPSPRCECHGNGTTPAPGRVSTHPRRQ